jgi:uncharacterized integral membrane protein
VNIIAGITLIVGLMVGTLMGMLVMALAMIAKEASYEGEEEERALRGLP